jgi:hypothetical protein
MIMEVSAPIAFKEWQVVCDALANGRQKILLRKGGIHEGSDGFSFAHQAFFLFPTRFHASTPQVREGRVEIAPEWQDGEAIRITHWLRVSRAITLFDWEQTALLEPLHIYTEETVRDRFYWQGRNMPAGSIHVAIAEVHTLARPWIIPYGPKFGGCRSWITLPDPPVGVLEGATPVVPQGELLEIAEKFFS